MQLRTVRLSPLCHIPTLKVFRHVFFLEALHGNLTICCLKPDIKFSSASTCVMSCSDRWRIMRRWLSYLSFQWFCLRWWQVGNKSPPDNKNLEDGSHFSHQLLSPPQLRSNNIIACLEQCGTVEPSYVFIINVYCRSVMQFNAQSVPNFMDNLTTISNPLRFYFTSWCWLTVRMKVFECFCVT